MSKEFVRNIVGLPIALLLFSGMIIYAQKPVVKPVTEEDIKANLSLAPCRNDDRLEAVKKLFLSVGATETDMTIDKFKDGQNLLVTKKGKTDNIIVISAHYDKVKDGCGAIDNWTGIVVIANLYRVLKNVDTDKTLVFVAFDKEELGLVGSEAMAKAIPKEKRSAYCSNINIDSFGFGYPQSLDNASSSKMTDMAKSLAKELNMPFAHASLSGTADADSSSFQSRGIPAITFHGLSSEWQKYLHSSKDTLENVNVSSVFIGYRFVVRFVAKVDGSDCAVFRK